MKAKPKQTSSSTRPSPTVLVGVILALAVLSLALLANSMTKPVSRDEQMYCTAGVLMAQGHTVYRDFSYPAQLPYHPLLLATLYRTFSTEHYLLVGRLVSVVCEILILISIVGIYRSVLSPHRQMALLLGTAAGALYVFNPMVDYAAGYAWNHDVVVLCVVLSLWLLITTDFQGKRRHVRLALMGALLTFATCMRITTALVEVFFLVALCVAARGSLRNRVYAILPFSLASLAVLVWPVSIAIRAGEAFRLNLIRIPALYGHWLQEIGIVHSKISLTLAALSSPGYLALVALAGYLVWLTAHRWKMLEPEMKAMSVTAGVLPLLFFVIAYIPPTMWRQYLAIPVPFLVIALAYPFAALLRRSDTGKPARIACLVTIVSLVIAVLANVGVLARSIAVLVPENWTPIVLHNVSTKIVSEMAEPKRVLTLGPLYALEGGGGIYPELASGAVVYRVADAMSAEERAMTHTVGLSGIRALTGQFPPDAVVLGVEPSYFSFLEDPLRGVTSPGWPRDLHESGLQIYRRP